jgi:hypothetical protein
MSSLLIDVYGMRANKREQKDSVPDLTLFHQFHINFWTKVKLTGYLMLEGSTSSESRNQQFWEDL